MRAAFGIVASIVLVLGAYVAFTAADPAPVTSETVSYRNERYGIGFLYPSGYVVREALQDGSALREHFTITLSDENAQEGEVIAAPSIRVDIYQNDIDAQSTREWILNTSASQYKLSADALATTSLDGHDALIYRWDSTLTGTSIVHASEEWVYAFSVTYADASDPIVRDFAELIQRVDIGDSELR